MNTEQRRTLSCWLLASLALVTTQVESTFAMDKEDMSEECYNLLHNKSLENSPEYLSCLDQIDRNPTTLVITPMRRAQDIKQAPASIAVINKEQVSNSTADSLAELVRDVPGIEVTDSGQAGLKRIRIRGEASRRVAIQIDGQPFTDEREVGTPILIAPEMIERIEILRGTSSVLHGSRGIGGVVNIITKKGGFHPLQATASTLYDSATNGSQHFGSVYGDTKGYEYRFAYSKSDHDNRNSPQGDIEDTEYKNDSLSLFLSKVFGAHTFGISYDDYDSSSAVYVDPVVATTPPFIDFSIDAPKRDRSKAALFYDWEVQRQFFKKLHADFYYQKSERQFNTFSELELDFGQGAFVRNSDVYNDSTLETVGSNIVSEFAIDSHTLIAGVDLKTDSLEQSRRRQLQEGGEQLPDEIVDDEAQQDSIEIFAQDEWAFAQGWSVITGARGYWYRTALESSTREGLTPYSSTDVSAATSIGLKHLLSEDTTVWGTWSQGYVVPTLINTTVGAFAGPDFVSPNADLDPETSHGFDLGLRHVDEMFSFEVSTFLTRARNYIEHVSCKQTDVSCIEPTVGRRDRVYVNIDRATTYGVEIATSYSATSFLTPYMNASWLRRRYEQNDVDTYDTGLPIFSGRAGLRAQHKLKPGVQAWADLYFRAATDAREADGDEIAESAGWATINLSLGSTIGRKESLRIVLDLLNLGDKSYEAATENLPARGRSAIVKLVADI